MKYDTVLFDLDGTLLNTLDDLANSVNDVLRQRGYPRRSREEIREFIGNGARSLMTRALPEGVSESEVLCCLELFRKVYMANMQVQTAPYEGIPALLKRLKAMGIKTGVVSNKPDEATRAVCGHYFPEDIDAAIGDNADRRKKPAPDNLYEAMKQLGAVKARTLYVGDSDTDMLTAVNAGVDSVGVAWGYRSRETLMDAGASHIIDEPSRLLALIETPLSHQTESGGSKER